jgi:hypothetical protein
VRNYSTATAVHIVHHGGNAEIELMEIELGFEAAFALFHLDDLLVNGV